MLAIKAVACLLAKNTLVGRYMGIDDLLIEIAVHIDNVDHIPDALAAAERFGALERHGLLERLFALQIQVGHHRIDPLPTPLHTDQRTEASVVTHF